MTRKIVSRREFVDPNLVDNRIPGSVSRVNRGTILAEWSCNSCSTNHIQGNIKVCPNCGNPKGEDEIYTPPSGPRKFLSDVELTDMGASRSHEAMDQLCNYCGSKNRTDAIQCSQCGRPFEDKSEQAHTYLDPPIDFSVSYEGKLSSHVPNYIFIGGIAILLLSVILGLFFLLRPKNETMVVYKVAWNRIVQVEEYQYNQHSGWSLPTGADLVSTDSRIHHYDQVLDHYEQVCEWVKVLDGYESVYSHTVKTCYDDGTCDLDDVYDQEPVYRDDRQCDDIPQYRDEPAYATSYTYNTWEWVRIDPLVASNNNLEVYWPSTENLPENQRTTGQTSESYSVEFMNNKEKTYNYKPKSVEEFQQYTPHSKWSVKRNSIGITQVLERVSP